MIRRFKLIGGSSAKFWEVTVVGQDVTVRYGRLGNDGQALSKTFPDNTKAQKHADKLIAQKTRMGYRETVAS